MHKDDFIRIEGKVKEGPKSVILAGVHGDERPGIEAFKEILPNLKIDKGIVWLGWANPIYFS